MGTMLEFRCRKLGSPEYVLVRAGLFRVDDNGVHACDKLTRLFRGNPMPPLEQVVETLVGWPTCR
jgi:hypothetical protein